MGEECGGGGSSSTVVVPSLPPPRPKSPPEYPDLYGKRRELAKVQMLEREIRFLEGELKFVDTLQPASRCCKEVADFVVASSDPFMPISKKTRRPCRFWKWLCRAPCICISSICCFGCTPRIEMPDCCSCNLPNCPSCVNCSVLKCHFCPWRRSKCCEDTPCNGSCCFPRCFRCSNCFCKRRCSCPKVNLCCCCTKNCCQPCWLCF